MVDTYSSCGWKPAFGTLQAVRLLRIPQRAAAAAAAAVAAAAIASQPATHMQSSQTYQ
jgi:hypothetical protein